MNDQDALRKAYPNLLGFLERETGRWNDIEVMNFQLEAENDRLREREQVLESQLAAAVAQLAQMQGGDHE
jgi:hypothetical protein